MNHRVALFVWLSRDSPPTFSLFALRKMSSQESQRPEQEMEDVDGLAVGPLLVTKLQARSS